MKGWLSMTVLLLSSMKKMFFVLPNNCETISSHCSCHSMGVQRGERVAFAPRLNFGNTLLSVLIMLVLTMNGYENVKITLNMFK